MRRILLACALAASVAASAVAAQPRPLNDMMVPDANQAPKTIVVGTTAPSSNTRDGVGSRERVNVAQVIVLDQRAITPAEPQLLFAVVRIAPNAMAMPKLHFASNTVAHRLVVPSAPNTASG